MTLDLEGDQERPGGQDEGDNQMSWGGEVEGDGDREAAGG